MNLNEWFDKGLTKEDYEQTLTNHKDAFNYIYENFSIPDADKESLATIKQQDLRVLIIAQEFCGHCMLDLPIMFRVAEETNMPVSLFVRDDNLELMDHYLTNEKRVIPIFVFINDAGEEVAKWGPLAPEVKKFMDELKVDMPTKDDPNFEAAFQAIIKKVGTAFKYEEKYWNYVYQDIINKLLIK